jgi:hypothetical protein
LGFIPCHNSYGVISTDRDGALFSVKVVVSKALSLKYNGNFIDDTFDPTMSNKVDFISRTLHTPMVFREIQVYGTIPQLLGVC